MFFGPLCVCLLLGNTYARRAKCDQKLLDIGKVTSVEQSLRDLFSWGDKKQAGFPFNPFSTTMVKKIYRLWFSLKDKAQIPKKYLRLCARWKVFYQSFPSIIVTFLTSAMKKCSRKLLFWMLSSFTYLLTYVKDFQVSYYFRFGSYFKHLLTCLDDRYFFLYSAVGTIFFAGVIFLLNTLRVIFTCFHCAMVRVIKKAGHDLEYISGTFRYIFKVHSLAFRVYFMFVLWILPSFRLRCTVKIASGAHSVFYVNHTRTYSYSTFSPFFEHSFSFSSKLLLVWAQCQHLHTTSSYIWCEVSKQLVAFNNAISCFWKN